LKAIYLKYGVGYRLSRFQTGPNEGDWLVVVTYARCDGLREGAGAFCPSERSFPCRIKLGVPSGGFGVRLAGRELRCQLAGR
jgi:hypothetical protein